MGLLRSWGSSRRPLYDAGAQSGLKKSRRRRAGSTTDCENAADKARASALILASVKRRPSLRARGSKPPFLVTKVRFNANLHPTTSKGEDKFVSTLQGFYKHLLEPHHPDVRTITHEVTRLYREQFCPKVEAVINKHRVPTLDIFIGL
jgi:hypothetical protein